MPSEHEFQVPTLPEAWCARVQREHPELSFEILGIFPDNAGNMVETVRITGRDPTRALDTIRFTETVQRFEIVHAEPEACVVRIRMFACGPCLAAQRARLAPTFPSRLNGGECLWRLQTSPDLARDFATELVGTRQAPTLMKKRPLERPPLLTPRQREILHAAVTEGYYARPRRVSLSGLADLLKIRKSTLSQSLSTIEAKLLPRWAEHLAEEDYKAHVTRSPGE